ncbi:MAG: hypothetical protein H0T79_12970, partial [Deltaproteobacteria bacterium]|nr:hypothetical protein [Deltaproteobacteria bacterium]
MSEGDPVDARGTEAMPEPELVLSNARVMTCDPARPGLGVIEHAAIAIADGLVTWIGPHAERPRAQVE